MWIPGPDDEAVQAFGKIAAGLGMELEDPKDAAAAVLHFWYLTELCQRRGLSVERLGRLVGGGEAAGKLALGLILRDPAEYGIELDSTLQGDLPQRRGWAHPRTSPS